MNFSSDSGEEDARVHFLKAASAVCAAVVRVSVCLCKVEEFRSLAT